MDSLIQNYRLVAFKLLAEFSSTILFAIFLSAILIGCIIPIPRMPDPPPFSNSEPLIQPGRTTVDEVTKILGTPNAALKCNSVYVYTSLQNVATLFGIGNQNLGFEDFARKHIVIVEFDKNGIVKYFDHLTGTGSVTTS